MLINTSQIRIRYDAYILLVSIAIMACLHYADAVIVVRFYYTIYDISLR